MDPSSLPSPVHATFLILPVTLKPSEDSPLGVGNVCLYSGREAPAHSVPCLAWGRNSAASKNRQSGLNHLQEGRMNLNRLNDQDSMNRGVFSSTLPSIGNCSIFSNTQRKSIFLKVPVTLSSFSLGNEAAANHSSFQPLRL